MSNRNHFLYFDPGAAATGWAYVCLDRRAFSRPEHRVLTNIVGWRSGELIGHEYKHLSKAAQMIRHIVDSTNYLLVEVGTEDFDLVQTIGGKNLLSPVRINAVLDWEARKNGLKLRYQNRALRTSQTKERLKLFGFDKRFKKDEFAAMQHLVYRLRTLKKETKYNPWKLNSSDQINAYWDCSCAKNRLMPCDLSHPR